MRYLCKGQQVRVSRGSIKEEKGDEEKKKEKKQKKRLTGRGKFGNIDKLSQGAELPRLETKKDEKK